MGYPPVENKVIWRGYKRKRFNDFLCRFNIYFSNSQDVGADALLQG